MNCHQWRTQKVSDGGPSFVTIVRRHQPALLLLKLLGFALHFLFLGSEGGHGTVAYPLGTLVTATVAALFCFANFFANCN